MPSSAFNASILSIAQMSTDEMQKSCVTRRCDHNIVKQVVFRAGMSPEGETQKGMVFEHPSPHRGNLENFCQKTLLIEHFLSNQCVTCIGSWG